MLHLYHKQTEITMKYTQELNILLAKANKNKKWLAAKLGFERQTFWRKVSQDKLSEGQKSRIVNILSK